MAVDPLAQFSAKSTTRILEPMDRISEVRFGLIMALTFTLTLGVVTADTIQVRTMLLGALGCNLAWGIIDAGVFLMARFNQRGRSAMQLRAVRAAADIKDADTGLRQGRGRGRAGHRHQHQYFSATNFIFSNGARSSYLPLSDRLGSLTLPRDTFLNRISFKICEMQLSRARRLSSERTMYQGACLLLVFSSIMSRARE
jgi:hypothetical protein